MDGAGKEPTVFDLVHETVAKDGAPKVKTIFEIAKGTVFDRVRK